MALLSLLSKTFPYLLGTRSEPCLSVLSYHRVHAQPDPMRSSDPSVDRFTWQMEVISKYFNPLPLSEAARKMASGTLPERAVSITFDDGYADNYTQAMPVLQRLGVPATLFVATKFLDGGAMWNDKIIEAVRAMNDSTLDLSKIGLGDDISVQSENQEAVAQDILASIKHWNPARREDAADYIYSLAGSPDCDPMLSNDQLMKLPAGGVEIGGHTHSHPVLTALPDDEAEAEILEGKQRLEGLLGNPLKVFAYPNGRFEADYSLRHAKMVERAGFIAAVTTELGVSNRRSDFFQLPRYTPWDDTPLRFLTRLHLARRNVLAP